MERIIMNTGITETGYSCCCDLLPGWVVSGPNDFAKFKKEVKESIDFYIECAKADGEEYPPVFDSDYEIVYKFDVRSLLEYYRGIFSFASLQLITGINQKQLAHYASGISKPRHKQAKKIAEGLHSLATELLTVTV